MSNNAPLSDEDMERYYDDIVAALRASLTRVSEFVRDIDITRPRTAPDPEPDELVNDPARPPLPPEGMWIPYVPRAGFVMPRGVRRPPPPLPLGAGFQLVDVARLGQRALIAFRWQETGDETYVYIVDMREYVHSEVAPGKESSIIDVNFLEQIGKGWLRHASLQRIRGLTFVE